MTWRRWAQPCAVYDFDAGGDVYRLHSVARTEVKELVASTLTVRESGEQLATNVHLENDLLRAPFLVLRRAGRATKAVGADGKERDHKVSLAAAPDVDFHFESGMLMLHYASPLHCYEANALSGVLQRCGTVSVMSGVLCVPLELRAHHVSFLTHMRAKAVNKQVLDRRALAITARGTLASYSLDTMRLK